MRDFRKLTVWQKAHDFTLRVYRETARFPSDERFGLRSQLRRSGMSIGSNIAEGCGRDTEAEFARYLSIAGGSATEAEYQLLLARDLGYFEIQDDWNDLNERINEVKKMLSALRRRLKAS